MYPPEQVRDPVLPLTEEEKEEGVEWLLTSSKEELGVSKWLPAPTDIGEEAALKLCEQLLDDRHYDLLLDETGLVVTPNFEQPLCILLKKRLPQDLLDAVRPVVCKAASQRNIATGNRGDAAGTGMQLRRRKDGTIGKVIGVPRPEDLNDEDYKRIGGATDGTVGFLDRSTRPGGQVYPCRSLLLFFRGSKEIRDLSQNTSIESLSQTSEVSAAGDIRSNTLSHDKT